MRYDDIIETESGDYSVDGRLFPTYAEAMEYVDDYNADTEE